MILDNIFPIKNFPINYYIIYYHITTKISIAKQ